MANTAAGTLINRALDNVSRLGTTTTRNGTTLSNVGIDVLNRGMFRLARRHTFRELKQLYSGSTVTSTKTYAFPTNYNIIYDIRVIDGSSSVKLEHVQGQYFDEAVAYPEDQTTGRPHWYIPYGHTFDVYPIPDAAYVLYLRCSIWPTVITATTDTVIFDSDKDDLLVYAMTEEFFSLLQMHEDSAIWGNKFKEALRYSIDNDSKYPDWNPVARGFDFSKDRYVGDPWKDPFVTRNM